MKCSIHDTFFFMTYEWTQLAGVYVDGRLFQPCLMFVDKTRSQP